MSDAPTPAQSDETLQDAVNKILDEYAGKYKPREYSDKIIGRIFDAVEGALPEKMTNTKDEGNSDWFYGYGYNAAIDELRAAIKRLREGIS